MSDQFLEEVPTLDEYVKGLRKKDADAEKKKEEREAKRKREREEFLAEKKAMQAAMEPQPVAAPAPVAAATPAASAYNPNEAAFVKVPEPTDSVPEPAFDTMKDGERTERWLLDGSKQQSWTVGREAGKVDFKVVHESCSREHARVQMWQGTVILTDLGSVHGTHVDGRRLPPNVGIRLHKGANVKFGASTRICIFRMPRFHTPAMLAASKASQAAAPAPAPTEEKGGKGAGLGSGRFRYGSTIGGMNSDFRES